MSKNGGQTVQRVLMLERIKSGSSANGLAPVVPKHLDYSMSNRGWGSAEARVPIRPREEGRNIRAGTTNLALTRFASLFRVGYHFNWTLRNDC
jgi:hypothetical protein